MQFGGARIVCPYWKREEKKKIVCEGIVDQTATHIAFKSAAKREEYCETYCADIKNYRRCMVCAMLEGKYKEKAEG